MIFLCLTSLAFAQAGGTEPKRTPEEYDVHADVKDVAVGAEFMVHSFSGQGQMYTVTNYLVVEVALYPSKDVSVKPSKYKKVDVDAGTFSLRINGKKQALVPVTPQMVAASLRNSEWQDRPRLEAGGGIGNTGVILGRPVPTTVPGGQQPAPPRAPRAPDADPPGGIEREPRVTPEELVVETALPQGIFAGPVSGFIYFPYKGKTSGIKTLELLYEDAILKLR